jgi:hypothetical protein
MKQFVLESHWDEAKDGPLPKDKVVEHFVFGELRRGVFKEVGEAGRYDVEEYQDNALEEHLQHHDGTGPLAEQGLANKKEALQGVFQEAADGRDARAVQAPQQPLTAEGVRELLAQMQLPVASATGQETAAGQVPAAAATGDTSTAPELDEEQEAEEIDEEEPDAGMFDLASVLGAPKAKSRAAKAKAKPAAAKASAPPKVAATTPSTPAALPAKAKSAEVRGANPVSFPREETPSQASAKKRSQATKSQPAQDPAERSSMSLDGRGRRLKESLNKETGTLKETLSGLMEVDDDFLTSADRASSRAIQKQKVLKRLVNDVKKQMVRATDSPNRAGLATEIEALEILTEHTHILSDLYGRLYHANPMAEELTERVQVAARDVEGLRLGAGVWKKVLDATFSHCVLYRDFAKYWQTFDSEQAGACLFN